MIPAFKTSEATFENRRLYGAIAEFGNAVIAFFWEGDEPRLGTLTVTLPNRSSSTLLGDRNQQIGLILGAQITVSTGKIALVSTNLQDSIGDVLGKTLLDLARKILSGEKKNAENLK